jgi:hypothetical protein
MKSASQSILKGKGQQEVHKSKKASLPLTNTNIHWRYVIFSFKNYYASYSTITETI